MEKIAFADLSKEEQDLVVKAKEASNHYFNPKGTHYVGAALSSLDGSVFEGAAIRRTSASSNSCSERVAIDQATFNGHHGYKAIALVPGSKLGEKVDAIFPCGLCRQIILEYYPGAGKGSLLVSNSDMSEVIRTDIHELFPAGYRH